MITICCASACAAYSTLAKWTQKRNKAQQITGLIANKANIKHIELGKLLRRMMCESI